MMLCKAISTAIESVEILSPLSYSFNGGPAIEVAPFDAMADAMRSSSLAIDISNTLYFNCYATPFDPQVFRVVGDFLPPADEHFQRELSSANQSREGYQPGWQLMPHSPDGKTRVRRGLKMRTVSSGEFSWAGSTAYSNADGTVQLRHQRESIGRQPVFYYMYGEELTDQFSEFNRVRFYFNCEAAGAPPLLRHLTSRLNEFRVPFQMKCLNSPEAYNRTDAAVLYLQRRHFQIGAKLVSEAAIKLATFFRPEIPLFSRKLIQGVGMADDPGAKDSFGTSRCRMLAEGLIDAWCANANSTEDRIQFVSDRFQSYGFDLNKPWLGKGVEDIFDDIKESILTV